MWTALDEEHKLRNPFLYNAFYPGTSSLWDPSVLPITLFSEAFIGLNAFNSYRRRVQIRIVLFLLGSFRLRIYIWSNSVSSYSQDRNGPYLPPLTLFSTVLLGKSVTRFHSAYHIDASSLTRPRSKQTYSSSAMHSHRGGGRFRYGVLRFLSGGVPTHTVSVGRWRGTWGRGFCFVFKLYLLFPCILIMLHTVDLFIHN